MTTSWLIHALAASPFFAGRVFLATFLTAALARWWEQIPILREAATSSVLASAPQWFTHDLSLVVLALLAVIEVAAEKRPELRQILDSVSIYGKAAVALAVQWALLDGTELGPFGPAIAPDPGAVAGAAADLAPDASVAVVPNQVDQGSSLLTFGLALIPTLAVAVLAWLRARLLGGLNRLDPNDDLRFQRLLSWLEDAFVGGGILLVALLPAIGLSLFGLALVCLFLLDRALAKRDLAHSQPCLSCGAPVHEAAPFCHHCDAVQPEPRSPTLLGRVTRSQGLEPEDQRMALVASRRCPYCATVLPERGLRQDCSRCGRACIADLEMLEQFLEAQRRPAVLAILFCAVAGSAPLLGLLPAILVYRWTGVLPLARYLSWKGGFLGRWFRRLLYAGLVILQLVPGFGLFALATLAAVDIGFHRRMLRREAQQLFASAG